MTTTAGSLNIKLLVTSLLDLFTDDVLQSVDRSHGKDSGNLRKQHASEAVGEVPEDDDDTFLDEDFSENDDPYIDKDGNFLANGQIVSDIDDDLALDDEEYHDALLGYREALVLLVDFILLLSPFGQTSLLAEEKVIPQASKIMCGKTGRGNGGRGSKGSGRLSDSRGRGRKEKGQRTPRNS